MPMAIHHVYVLKQPQKAYKLIQCLKFSQHLIFQQLLSYMADRVITKNFKDKQMINMKIL